MPTTSHLSPTDRGQATITDIRAMRLDSGFCLVRIDTDAGISGFGECGAFAFCFCFAFGLAWRRALEFAVHVEHNVCVGEPGIVVGVTAD